MKLLYLVVKIYKFAESHDNDVMRHATSILCLSLTLFLASLDPTQAKTITLGNDSYVRPTPCSGEKFILRLRKGTSLETIAEARVVAGMLTTIWYKVNIGGAMGWISDQNTTVPTMPIFDRSKGSQKCSWKVE